MQSDPVRAGVWNGLPSFRPCGEKRDSSNTLVTKLGGFPLHVQSVYLMRPTGYSCCKIKKQFVPISQWFLFSSPCGGWNRDGSRPTRMPNLQNVHLTGIETGCVLLQMTSSTTTRNGSKTSATQPLCRKGNDFETTCGIKRKGSACSPS